jgi:hypothetical protein
MSDFLRTLVGTPLETLVSPHSIYSWSDVFSNIQEIAPPRRQETYGVSPTAKEFNERSIRGMNFLLFISLECVVGVWSST